MRSSEQPRATAERLDQQEARAMVDGDLGTLDALWADQLLVTPPGGTPADKDTALRLVRDGVLAYRDVRREVDHVIVGDGMIVSLGRESVTPAGVEEHQVRRYTHVWVGQDGGWRLVARHASAATP